jgi:hypothetical protein
MQVKFDVSSRSKNKEMIPTWKWSDSFRCKGHEGHTSGVILTRGAFLT